MSWHMKGEGNAFFHFEGSHVNSSSHIWVPSLRELAIIIPIHFLVPTLAFWLLQNLLPAATFTSFAIDPVIYSERNPWIVDLVRETLVNALFTVGLLGMNYIILCALALPMFVEWLVGFIA